ncbi:MAG: 3-oxoacyl-ACP synthase III [Oligoflexia bacterium]|nr:3-oxoacyl-ACP synthase III [Oligoflexia bacterium]
MIFQYKKVGIAAMSYLLPEKVVTSEEIEEELLPIYQHYKLRVGRLQLMTGIKERRVGEESVPPSETAAKVVEKLFATTDAVDTVDLRRVELVIYAAVCRDLLEPATASIVHAKLKKWGLGAATMFFDLSNACLGVINALVVAAEMLERGTIKNALIVSAENSATLLKATIKHLLAKFNQGQLGREELKRHLASFTIGSGAFAMLLTHQHQLPHPNCNYHRIVGGSVLSDTSAAGLCRGAADSNDGGLLMETDSERLLQAGIALAVENWPRCLSILKEQVNSREGNSTEWIPDHIVTHQVGVAHQRLLAEKLNLDPQKIYSRFSVLGNTGSVAMPIALAMAAEEGIIKEQEKVALLGIGSGLSSIMLGVEW